MTKSELIALLAAKNPNLTPHDVEAAVKSMMDSLTRALATGERIEIRGFGSFSLHHRQPRLARNPKSGEAVMLSERYTPHFKPGKELRARVNASRPENERIR